MVVADLHLHTTNSDGTFEFEALPAAAKEAGLEAIAVTDHDRIHPALDEPRTTIDGIEIVQAIELRVDVESGGFRIDLLGYGPRESPRLTSLLERIQASRRERAREMVDMIESRLGIDLSMDIHDGIGRPHIARAVQAHPATSYDYQETFDHLIGNDGPCYVRRWTPSFDNGLDILKEAGAVVSLAHPFRYDDLDTALALCDRLDAIECYYPYGYDVDPERLERVIEANDLLVTGGSDAHELELGIAGVSRDEYDRLVTAIQ